MVLVVFRGATESEWAKDAEESSSVVSRGACIGADVFLVGVCLWWVCVNKLSLRPLLDNLETNQYVTSVFVSAVVQVLDSIVTKRKGKKSESGTRA